MSPKQYICDLCGDKSYRMRRRKGSDGLLRCDECKKVRDRQHKLNYNKSEKGKEAQFRYRGSSKQRSCMERFKKSDKGYVLSRKHCKIRYWRDPEGARLRVTSQRLGLEKTILYKVMKRDRVCQLCGINNNLEFDHIHPLKHGGKSTVENLQLLCQSCNKFKSDRLFLPSGGMMLIGRAA